MANLRVGSRSGFHVRGGKSVRETSWISIDRVAATLATANAAALLGTLNAAALLLRPFTVVRSRGIFHLESDQTAASEIVHIAIGLAVVLDQAAAIGVTAVPTPATDRASDLFYMYEEGIMSFVLGDSTGFVEPGGVLLSFDSKAMRKVNDDQDIALVAETETASGGGIIRLAGRMLIKLH